MSTNADKYDWNRLTRPQLGRYAEYLAKMEFTLCGCDVFTSEVDDHGIDFVIRTRQGCHYDVQVKSFRLRAGTTPYVFVRKDKFNIHPSLLLVLVQFVSGMPPTIFVVPSAVGERPNPIFESRDYGEGKKSKPEWGLTLSKDKLASLARECSFEGALAKLLVP